jgi:phosphoglycolate phosphatase
MIWKPTVMAAWFARCAKNPPRPNLSRPELICFDLDGTLVESAPDIAYSVDTTLTALGLPPVGEPRIRNWIGNGPAMLIKRALTGEMWPEGEPALFAEAFQLFIKTYETNMCARSHMFDGVEEGLGQLKIEGYRLACITNKNSIFTIPLLRQFEITHYFDFVSCGDQFEKLKPDPAPLLKTAKYFGIAPSRSLMVGDSVNDAVAARRAGFMLVCVPYGYHGGAGVEVLKPDAIVNSLVEIPYLFRQGGAKSSEAKSSPGFI